MQLINPKTSEIMTVMPNIGDYVHTRRTGDNTLDYEDRPNLYRNNWNFRCVENKASTIARAQGEKIVDINDRGLRKNTHTDKVKDDYFEINDFIRRN